MPAHYLGEVAIREALKRAGVEPGEVSEVVLGQVLTDLRLNYVDEVKKDTPA